MLPPDCRPTAAAPPHLLQHARRFQRYAPVRTRTHRELTLAFLGPHCWMPVRKQSAMTAIRLTLTGSSELRAAREMRTRMQQLELRPGTPPSTP